MSEHQVVVVGGGPTGMMLGAELTLARVDVVVVERRVDRDLDGSRAGGLHARTLEVLDQRGVADRFLAEGRSVQVHNFAGTPLDLSDFPTRHPHSLGLWQRDIERILGGWVDELAVPELRGREVVAVRQDAGGVEVELDDGTMLRAQYVVGCDGGRSVVRKAAAIGFPGTEPSTSWMIAEAEMVEEPQLGLRPEGGGIGPVDPEAGGGPYRAVLVEAEVDHAADPTLEDLRAILVAKYGTDFGVHSPRWISRFTDAARQAETYRSGRVLLAGDAAHIHPPQGGQGLNTGVQDAVNLGWKLAQVVHGRSPDELLDTYHAERHPVGAGAVRMALALAAVGDPDERHAALRSTIADVVALDEPRRMLAGTLSGLGIHYEGDGHPLVGWRMPDLDLDTAEGPTRVFALLHAARPVLLHLGAPGGADVEEWAGRIEQVDARTAGPWELPVVGEVPAPTTVLIRPDGHVAWAGDAREPGLRDALARWFGPPAAGPGSAPISL